MIGIAGFDVAVAFSKNEQRVQEVQEEILALGVQAMIVHCDVIDECSVLAMVDSVVRNFGAITAVVNCATTKIAASGIRVNSISPGMTMTEQVSDVPERVRLSVGTKTPLSRIADPQYIAKTVVFLSSDSSDFLCGETIRVNGGSVML